MNPFVLLWKFFLSIGRLVDMADDLTCSAQSWTSATKVVSESAASKWINEMELESDESIEEAETTKARFGRKPSDDDED